MICMEPEIVMWILLPGFSLTQIEKPWRTKNGKRSFSYIHTHWPVNQSDKNSFTLMYSTCPIGIHTQIIWFFPIFTTLFHSGNSPTDMSLTLPFYFSLLPVDYKDWKENKKKKKRKNVLMNFIWI